MYVRVVRFTDVDPEHLKANIAGIDESGGAPEGVTAAALTILHDEAQGTAVVLQYYDSKEDMESSAKVFAAMDPSDTPGTRASVDTTEVKLELKT